jgi:serine/threonine protein kinase
VEEAMNAIHTQGVVHLDWYLSNFMWKIDSSTGKLEVKIIDFDSAHIIGDTLTEETNMRLRGTRFQLAEVEPGGAADLRNYDISLMNLLRRNVDNIELCSNEKSILDGCFKSLQVSYVSSCFIKL